MDNNTQQPGTVITKDIADQLKPGWSTNNSSTLKKRLRNLASAANLNIEFYGDKITYTPKQDEE